MSKAKQNPKPVAQQPAKAKETSALPTVDDFFTQFLEKRKKYFVTKMDEISELERKDAESLKPDQREKINKKGETADRIKYFDDIKSLYSEAHAKKGTAPSEAAAPIDDLANLFALGHAIHNFDRNTKNFEHTFNSDQMTSIQDAYLSLTRVATASQLEEAKTKLREYSKNEELRKAVGQFLIGYKWEQATHHAHHAHHTHHTHNAHNAHNAHHVKEDEKVVHRSARKASGKAEQMPEVKEKPKRRLFADESEEEEDNGRRKKSEVSPAEVAEERSRSREDGQQGYDNDEVPMNFLTPLPEGDDKKTDEFRSARGNKGAPKKDTRPRPPREGKPEGKKYGYLGGDNEKPRAEKKYGYLGGDNADNVDNDDNDGKQYGYLGGNDDQPAEVVENEGSPSPSENPKPPRRNNNRDGDWRPPRNQGEGGDGERRPYRPRDGEDQGERRPYRPRGDGEGQGERRPYQPRGDGEGQRERRPYQPRGDGENQGERRPYQPRGDGEGQGERRPYQPRGDGEGHGERRPYQPRGDGEGQRERRPYQPRGDGEGQGERPRYNREGIQGDNGPRRPREYNSSHQGKNNWNRGAQENQAGDQEVKNE